MNKYQELVEGIARKHGLSKSLVYAICVAESGLDTWAVRFERKWHWFLSVKEWAKIVHITSATERVCQQMSWGLMQIMGSVARERGFSKDLSQLCRPEIGVEYGCRQLDYLLKRHYTTSRALSAYNTGNPDSVKGHEYAEHVMSFMGDNHHVIR